MSLRTIDGVKNNGKLTSYNKRSVFIAEYSNVAMKLTRCAVWRQHTRQNFIILNWLLKVLLETFVGHLCVSFKEYNYDSLLESRNALLLDMQRSTCTDRSVTCNLSGQEWLGILQLLPNLFKHLKCNRHYMFPEEAISLFCRVVSC